MSSTAAGPPPSQSGGNDKAPWNNTKGPGRSELPQDVPWAPEDNERNQWKINTKIKTCKCSICGERVKKDSYSFQCSECSFHICKQCAEPDGESGPMYKANAYFQLTNRCKCTYVGNRVPAFSVWLHKNQDLVTGPPKRFEEDRRMKEIKAKAKEKKLQKQTEVEAGSSALHKRPSEEEDGTHHGPSVSQPTLTSRKPDRKQERKDYRDPSTSSDCDVPDASLRKKTYLHPATDNSEAHGKRKISPAEFSERGVADDLATFMRPKKQTKSGAPVKHLREGTTIIIGAGIVGLCIGRELAKTLNKTKTHHKIIVVDVQESYCRMASGGCAGLLSIYNLDERIDQLAKLSQECWGQMFAADNVDELIIGSRKRGVYTVSAIGKDACNDKPTWFTGHKPDDFQLDLQTIGKLDTKKLADWLFAQCLQLGVDFRFKQKIGSITKTKDRDIKSVRLQHPEAFREEEGEKVECQNLVVAAGPFTSQIVHTCYRKVNLEHGVLKNFIQRAVWVDLPLNPISVKDKDDVGINLPTLARTSNTLEDKITMVAQPGTSVIRMSATTSAGGDGALPIEMALNPKHPDLVPMRQLENLVGSVYKKSRDMKSDESIIKNKQFAFITKGTGELPIIDKIPASKLGVEVDNWEEADARPDGVWVCYGFGMYGTTLAPGAARALVRRIVGKRSGIEDARFSIAQ